MSRPSEPTASPRAHTATWRPPARSDCPVPRARRARPQARSSWLGAGIRVVRAGSATATSASFRGVTGAEHGRRSRGGQPSPLPTSPAMWSWPTKDGCGGGGAKVLVVDRGQVDEARVPAADSYQASTRSTITEASSVLVTHVPVSSSSHRLVDPNDSILVWSDVGGDFGGPGVPRNRMQLRPSQLSSRGKVQLGVRQRGAL